MAVPIEAVRQAVQGARELPAAGDAGPAVVVVDGVSAKPAIGWMIGGHPAATVWVDDVPDWAKDAPHVRATAARRGALEGISSGAGATLFVITRK
jgi:hypothetical protein